MIITEFLPQLPPSVARYTLDSLFSILPLPVPDTPEARDRRDASALAALIALRPANAADAMLAVQIIGAQAHAMDCLRLANRPGLTIQEVLRFRAQAASLMREGLRGHSLLLRLQAPPKAAKTAKRPASPARDTADQHRVVPFAAQPKGPRLH